MTAMFQRIDTVFVPTRDIERALKWYAGILGGKPGWRSDNGDYQAVSFGDTSLTLFLTDEQVYYEPRRSAFNFYVPDAAEAYRHLQSHGVKVEKIEEDGAKYFAFYDLDGNCLEVCEY